VTDDSLRVTIRSLITTIPLSDCQQVHTFHVASRSRNASSCTRTLNVIENVARLRVTWLVPWTDLMCPAERTDNIDPIHRSCWRVIIYLSRNVFAFCKYFRPLMGSRLARKGHRLHLWDDWNISAMDVRCFSVCILNQRLCLNGLTSTIIIYFTDTCLN